MSEKVSVAVYHLNAMKDTYFWHRSKLASYKCENENADQHWEFSPRLVFHRYDRFLNRLASIQVSYQTISIILVDLYLVQGLCLGLVSSFFKASRYPSYEMIKSISLICVVVSQLNIHSME